MALRISRSTQESLRLFLVAAIGLAVIVPVSLYAIGGVELVRFSIGQLTWRVFFRVTLAMAALFTIIWIRHSFWYRDERPPMWLRRSAWVNLVEFLVLTGIIGAGVWAISRFR